MSLNGVMGNLPTPDMEDDTQRLQAWDLGAKVATLQAQGMREFHTLLRSESAAREKAFIKLLDDLLFQKTDFDARFLKMEGEISALRAELAEEKQSRLSITEALATERMERLTQFRGLEAGEEAAREDLKAELREDLVREERRRLTQQEQDHTCMSDLEERTHSLQSFEKQQQALNKDVAEYTKQLRQETLSKLSVLEDETRKLQGTCELIDCRKLVTENSVRLHNLEANQSSLDVQIQTNTRADDNDNKAQARVNADIKERLDTFQDAEVRFRQELLGTVKDIKVAGEHRDAYMGQQLAEAKMEAARHRESIRSIVEDMATRVATELEDHRMVLQRVDEVDRLQGTMTQWSLEHQVAKEELVQRHQSMSSHMDSLEKHMQHVTLVQRSLESDMMKEQAARQLCERRLESVGC